MNQTVDAPTEPGSNDFIHPTSPSAPPVGASNPAPKEIIDTPDANPETQAQESQDTPHASGKDSLPISRNMKISSVIAQLIQHGIPDLSARLKHSTFDEHPIDTNGAFSDVYFGQMQGDGEHVAAKVLRVSAQNFSEKPDHLKDAARELHTWSKCNHPNVLPLRGLANFRGRIGMISPRMEKGPLPEYLKNYPEEKYPNVNRIKICSQICKGLWYIHEKGIGANILVSEDGSPVLVDFGNSTLKDRSLKFTQASDSSGLTARWSAPERVVTKPTPPVSKASDIYSLGMEVITGQRPYHELEIRGYILWSPPGELLSTPNTKMEGIPSSGVKFSFGPCKPRTGN
ncbi:kinase-like domain-containing protein [Rhizoctonia solani]|nr:kinase-like domain-containing protein [Rhizoctonia solani]